MMKQQKGPDAAAAAEAEAPVDCKHRCRRYGLKELLLDESGSNSAAGADDGRAEQTRQGLEKIQLAYSKCCGSKAVRNNMTLREFGRARWSQKKIEIGSG